MPLFAIAPVTGAVRGAMRRKAGDLSFADAAGAVESVATTAAIAIASSLANAANAAGDSHARYSTVLADGSTETVTLGSGGGIVTREILRLSGVVEQFRYGITGAAYATEHAIFAKDGARIELTRLRADGSLEFRESSSDASGALLSSRFTETGLLTHQTVLTADHTRAELDYAADGVTVRRSAITRGDGIVNVTVAGISGSAYVVERSVFDALGNAIQVIRTRADGSLVSSEILGVADGSRIVSDYGDTGLLLRQAITTAGTSQLRSFASDGVRLVSDIISHADGAKDAYAFHLTGGGYSAEHRTLDAAGNTLAIVRTNAANAINSIDAFNSALGMAGDDLLQSMSGTRVLDGGAGRDTIAFDKAGAGVIASLGVATAQVTRGAGVQTILNIENILGSVFNDTLHGNALANVIEGGAGNDRLVGWGGADTFVFRPGSGTDAILDFGAGGEADRIDISSYLAAGLTPTLSNWGRDGWIKFENGDAIQLVGVFRQKLVATATGFTYASSGSDSTTVSLAPDWRDVQSSGAAWSYSIADGITRFEVRGGDRWSGDGSAPKERSETYTGLRLVTGQTYEINFSMMVEPGATNTASWMTLIQLQSTFDAGEGHSPPFAIEMVGDRMRVVSRHAPGQITGVEEFTFTNHFTDSQAITRGHWYDLTIQVRFDPLGNGHLTVIRDGVVLADYTGPLGFDDLAGVYLKQGVYRASASEAFAVDYKDTVITQILAPGAGEHGGSLVPQVPAEDDAATGVETPLRGTEGSDVFVVRPGEAVRIIEGFGAGGTTDTLDLSAFHAAGLVATTTATAEGTLIEFPTGESVLLIGIAPEALFATPTGFDSIDLPSLTEGNDDGAIDLTRDNDFDATTAGTMVDGAGGFDTLSFAAAAHGVTVTLGTAGLQETGIGRMAIVNVEALVGSAFDDVLSGSVGDDRLHGGAGRDRLFGGTGDDRLIGGNGADLLDGGAGRDVMMGGAGDDTYVVDEARDRVIELADGGWDMVYAGVNHALGDAVEALVLTGTARIGRGNALDNEITGNDQANTLRGEEGTDVLRGEAGDDILIGGAGADELWGGAGGDRFQAHSFADLDGDRIMDFAAGDLIDLRAIDAASTIDGNQRFRFIGERAFTGIAGQLRVEAVDGVLHLWADHDGDKVADHGFTVVSDHALTAADFLL
jgi:Ca2+-binding RTX toxin-like protein